MESRAALEELYHHWRAIALEELRHYRGTVLSQREPSPRKAVLLIESGIAAKELDRKW